MFKRALFVALVGLLCSQHSAHAQCTICADGSPSEGSFGGTDCSVIEASVASTPEDSDDCTQVRLEAFQYCSCPSFPDEFCSLCDFGDEGFENLPREYENYVIPSGGDEVLTCEDSAFLMGDQCTEFADYAWFCGCPSSERGDCYLCSDQRTPSKRYLPTPNFITCQELDRLGGSIYDANQCGGLVTNYFNVDISSLLDVETYCGCTDTSSPPAEATCSLCGAEGAVMNPTLRVLEADTTKTSTVTCNDLNDMAPHITNEDYCDLLQLDYAQMCCQAIVPTEAPAMPVAPVAPPPTPNEVMDTPAPVLAKGPAKSSSRIIDAVMASGIAVLAMVILV